MQQTKDAPNSGYNFCFWLLLAVYYILRFNSWVEYATETGEMRIQQLYNVTLALMIVSLICLILSAFSDREYHRFPLTNSKQARKYSLPRFFASYFPHGLFCFEHPPPAGSRDCFRCYFCGCGTVAQPDDSVAYRQASSSDNPSVVIDGHSNSLQKPSDKHFQHCAQCSECTNQSSSAPPIKSTPNNLPESPEKYVSFPSRMTFSWLLPLVYHGFRKPLKFEDLWCLDDENQASTNYFKFNQYLAKYLTVEKPIIYHREHRRSSLGTGWLSGMDYPVSGTPGSGISNIDSNYRRESTKSMINTSLRGVSSDDESDIDIKGGLTSDHRHSSRSIGEKPRRASDGANLSRAGSGRSITEVKLMKREPLSQNAEQAAKKKEPPPAIKLPESGASSPSVIHPPLINSNSHPAVKVRASIAITHIFKSPEESTETSRKASSRRSVRIREGTKPLFMPGESDDTLPQSEQQQTIIDKSVDTQEEPSTDAAPKEAAPKEAAPAAPSEKSSKVEQEKFDAGVLKSLLAQFWFPLLLTAFMKLVRDVINFLTPILLERLLAFLQ
ncbi:Multidrug resistance-associated protein 1, partial [Cichlidogyrus casuarinus]